MITKTYVQETVDILERLSESAQISVLRFAEFLADETKSTRKEREEQLIEALVKKTPIAVELKADENGHIVIDRDLHPDLYDWVVND